MAGGNESLHRWQAEFEGCIDDRLNRNQIAASIAGWIRSEYKNSIIKMKLKCSVI